MWKTSKGDRGLGLVELIVALTLFSCFLVAVFGLFGKGVQAFGFLQSRQSLQSELLQLRAVLERDFRLTHLSSVGVESRVLEFAGVEVHRDLVCGLTLDDWNQPANFEENTGIPLWNRHFVYLSTSEETGVLKRVEVLPESPPPLRIQPLPNLSEVETATLSGRSILTRHLDSFRCVRDATLQEVAQTVRLRKKGGKRGLDDKKTDEVMEATFVWRPVNTTPRL